MFDALAAEPEVDAQRIVLVGRSFGKLIAPRGTSGEHRLAAMIVDPGQFEMGPALLKDLGPLADHVHDPAADEQFQRLLDQPQMKAFLAPRMATHGVSTVRDYCEDAPLQQRRDGHPDHLPDVRDRQRDRRRIYRPGQAALRPPYLPEGFSAGSPRSEGAEGHCEGMAPTVFWDAAPTTGWTPCSSDNA